MKWKWANVPIPPQHLLGLILGAVLQFVLKHSLFATPRVGVAVGLPLIFIGVVLSGWSVFEAGGMEIEKPTKLLLDGPYSLSRNPTYVAWTLMYLGIGLAANSLWIVVLLPAVVAFTHIFDVLREERFLEKKFGEEYIQYKERVRRYF